jgi:hypothetical protein
MAVKGVYRLCQALWLARLELVRKALGVKLLALQLNRLFNRYAINYLLDVGTRQGVFGWLLRRADLYRSILSFELVESNLTQLRSIVAVDRDWSVQPYAPGLRDATSTIDVTHRTHLSSFRDSEKLAAEKFRVNARVVATHRKPMPTRARKGRPSSRWRRPLLALTLLGALLGCSAVHETDFLTLPSAAAKMPQITISGDQILRGGQSWWLLGYNSFVWSGDCGLPQELMSADQVDSWFASMRHDGHGAVRLFFFRGWNLNRLDAALASAKKYNIYLTITLADAHADCGEPRKNSAWFDNPSAQTSYIDHMTTLLTRYKGETAIAWFEYFNEPDYADGRLRRFYDSMGTIARRIDPTRLLSSGTVAPYWLGGTANFLDVNKSAGVDIVSLHEYDYTEAESHHGPSARANSDGKPVIVGEFGVSDPKSSAVNRQASIAQRASLVKNKVESYITIPGYAGAMAWAWQPGSSPTACPNDSLNTDNATQEILRTATQLNSAPR